METTIFDTALGMFGLSWTDKGVARLLLPGMDREALGQRLDRHGARSTQPPRAIEKLINQIEDYAEGESARFSDVELDLTGVPDFHQRAYAILLRTEWGTTTTYGALARELGDVKLSRAVGQAMGANPIPLIIPCHRVLASDGRAGGFSAPGGADAKARMLLLEGVALGTPAGQMVLGF